ncbi:MAG: cyclic pyranopterin monophosphate synthase MoaC [Gammaproteobacteria bacterium]|nr:cyclic pyranopterin monophosphate synthase MoaC [Gammaproteobacteria bacterium]
MAEEFTHLDGQGHVHMIDVGDKQVTNRGAVAEAIVRMAPETSGKLFGGDLPKGDALAAARLAGIMAAKRTADLIPLCHPLSLTSVSVEVYEHGDGARVEARVQTRDRTGVEMEAMTAVSVAALTLYDMVKGVERGVEITGVRLLSKSGGRSGEWRR